MLIFLSKHTKIIHEDSHEISEVGFKVFVGGLTERRWTIFQAKTHDYVDKCISLNYKCCFVHVFRGCANFIVPIETMKEGIHLMSCYII